MKNSVCVVLKGIPFSSERAQTLKITFLERYLLRKALPRKEEVLLKIVVDLSKRTYLPHVAMGVEQSFVF